MKLAENDEFEAYDSISKINKKIYIYLIVRPIKCRRDDKNHKTR